MMTRSKSQTMLPQGSFHSRYPLLLHNLTKLIFLLPPVASTYALKHPKILFGVLLCQKNMKRLFAIKHGLFFLPKA